MVQNKFIIKTNMYPKEAEDKNGSTYFERNYWSSLCFNAQVFKTHKTSDIFLFGGGKYLGRIFTFSEVKFNEIVLFCFLKLQFDIFFINLESISVNSGSHQLLDVCFI